MNKFFNWTFGSFFRTLGRFLFYLLIGFLISKLINIADIKLPSLFNVLEVDAREIYGVSVDDWNLPTTGMFWNLGSSGNDSRGYTIYDGLYAIPTQVISMSGSGKGMGISICNLNLVKDMYYSISILQTSVQSIYLHPTYSTSTYKLGQANSLGGFYQEYNYESISSGIQQINYDGYYFDTYTMIFKARQTNTCLNITQSSNSQVYSYKDQFQFIGYKLESMGAVAPSTTEISNALNSQFNQLNTSINGLSSTITNAQNSINNSINQQSQQQHQDSQDIKNAMTDDSAPNLSGLNNSAGWLPAGPVDSILNLPLSFLTNLSNNLSRSCSPVSLPLPYINQTLELPCLNSVYNQINGLPNWLNTIGTIASAFILFGYLINLYKYIDDTLTFRENNYIDNWSGV